MTIKTIQRHFKWCLAQAKQLHVNHPEFEKSIHDSEQACKELDQFIDRTPKGGWEDIVGGTQRGDT